MIKKYYFTFIICSLAFVIKAQPVITYNGNAVDAGLGEDRITFNDDTIDFNNIAAISNVEQVDISAGSHTIKNISAADVISMTDESNTLTILGDDADRVELLNTQDSQWSKESESVSENGHTFDVYTDSEGVKVQIETNIDDVVQS